MPQIQLPMFPAGSVEINADLACCCEAETVVYFHGHLPVFTHSKDDVASFRMKQAVVGVGRNPYPSTVFRMRARSVTR